MMGSKQEAQAALFHEFSLEEHVPQDLLRRLFETTVARWIAEGLVSGQRFAADASLIKADANKQNSTAREDWDHSAIDPANAPRAARAYLDVLNDAAFGAASAVEPKFTSHSDPSSQWTAARKGPAFFSYSTNYLFDTDHSVIVDVEAPRSIRQAEVGAVRTMLDRANSGFDAHPERIIADTAYGSGPMLAWLVGRKIAPHIPVIDKAGRTDGTWTRADFEWDVGNDQYICPEGQELKQFGRNYSDPNRGPTGKGAAKYRALKLTCQSCPSKARCRPNMDFRFITREEHEDARQIARAITRTRQYEILMKPRKKVEMLFAHLKRILGPGRLRLRGPCGAKGEFLLAATAQNLRKPAKIFPARGNHAKPDWKGSHAICKAMLSAPETRDFSTKSAENIRPTEADITSNPLGARFVVGLPV